MRDLEKDYKDFLVWLAKKDPDETFSYGDLRNCAYAQFLKDTMRVVYPLVQDMYWMAAEYDGGQAQPIPPQLTGHTKRGTPFLEAKTFGKLQKRLLGSKVSKYLDAIDKVIEELGYSDFVTHCGDNALRELREYREDMALTLQRELK